MLLPVFHHHISQTWNNVFPCKSWMCLHLPGLKGHRGELKCAQWFTASLNLEEPQFVVTVCLDMILQSFQGPQLSMGQALLQQGQPKPEQQNPAGIHRGALSTRKTTNWKRVLFLTLCSLGSRCIHEDKDSRFQEWILRQWFRTFEGQGNWSEISGSELSKGGYFPLTTGTGLCSTPAHIPASP